MSTSIRSLFTRQDPDIPGEVISFRESLKGGCSVREACQWLTFLECSGLVLYLRNLADSLLEDDGRSHRALPLASFRSSPSVNFGKFEGMRTPVVEPGLTLQRLPAGILWELDRAGTPPPGSRALNHDVVSFLVTEHLRWTETTGEGFNGDWTSAMDLPAGIVLGFKHRDDRERVVVWNGQTLDPANEASPPPRGFVRRGGGGCFWYEKLHGPELIQAPTLTVRLPRSLYMRPGDGEALDSDHDGLVDTMEGLVAQAFRPLMVFDSDETARLNFEPVVLFQVRPLSPTPAYPYRNRVAIKWVFLFNRDGGYGPNAGVFCNDAHFGDNDDALFEIESIDEGITWKLVRATLGLWQSPDYLESDALLRWPAASRMEVRGWTHPVIWMSASKHHEYFNMDNDHKDSFYSSYKDYPVGIACNDDVNGGGAQVMANLQSLAMANGYYHNVGEPESHPSPPFVNDLSKHYPARSLPVFPAVGLYQNIPADSAWEAVNGFGGSDQPMARKWIRVEGGWLKYG